jgi:hypothetical protein
VPEDINLEIFNADPITEDVSDAAPQAGTEAAPKTYAPLDAAAESQADLSAEMKSIGEAYAAALKNGAKAEIQPGSTTHRTAAASCATRPKTCTTRIRKRLNCTPRPSGTWTCMRWNRT